jgi:hypothetical protein
MKCRICKSEENAFRHNELCVVCFDEIKYKHIENEYIDKEENRFLKTSYIQKRRSLDPLYRLMTDIRAKTRMAIKNKSWRDGGPTQALLGVDKETFMSYLESKFTDGMSWDNYGEVWNLDHIVPLSSANDETQMYNLAHFLNVRPIYKNDNLIKSDHVPNEIISRQSPEDCANDLTVDFLRLLDCDLATAKKCAIKSIEFMLNNSFSDIQHWEKVKSKLL